MKQTTLRERQTTRRWPAVCWMAVALGACSSPAATTPETDTSTVADVDSAADTAVADVPADVSVTLLHPELDPALCVPGAPLDWRGVDPAYVPLSAGPTTIDHVQDKAWYVFTVLQQYPQARTALLADAGIAAIAQAREDRLRQASTCATGPGCVPAAVAWLPDEITGVAALTADVLAKTDVAAVHLRKSGRFVRDSAKSDRDLIAAAVTEGLQLLQQNYQNYAAGRQDLGTALQAIADKHPDKLLFFEPLLWATLDGLRAAKQDQAGRDEPLADGENKAALARLKTIDWSQWRFTVILGPGWGPDDPQTALSQNGQDHCDIEAERWKAGLAPFILLSGGHVHPSADTPYSEALEMKKYLMAAHQVPENAIIVDPHARHTTTNLRNTSRQLLRYGFPPEKPALISTDTLQAFYIIHLDVRCNDELGYLPYRGMTGLAPNDDCFFPAIDALQGDARDERDP